MSLGVLALDMLVVAAIVCALCMTVTNGPPAGGRRNRNGKEGEGRSGKEQATVLFGVLLGAAGLLSAVSGLIASFTELTLDSLVPASSMGAVMGAIGYFLGARRLGAAAAIVAGVALILGLAVSQGMVPGLDRTDHNLPAVEPSAE